MLRAVALRMGTGLAAAGAASVANPRTAGADVRTPRSTALPRATKTTEGSQEEAWLEVTLGEDGVIFSPYEVEETVEEIVGLCENTNEHEGTDAGDASAVCVSHPATEEGRFMADIFRVSQRLVSHPAVQSAAITAMQDDTELRQMIEDLSNCHLEPVEAEAAPMIEYDAPVRRHRHNTPLLTMFEDIARQLGRLGRAVQGAGGRVARLFRRVISWLVASMKEAVDMITKAADDASEAVISVFPSSAKFLGELGPSGKAGSLVAAGAMLIFVVMIMKRRTA